MGDFQLDPKFIAGIDLLRRSGMTQFRIGYTDDDTDRLAAAIAYLLSAGTS